MATYYVPVDTDLIAVDSNHITIEGADKAVGSVKSRPIHINDYLGVGTPELYR
jgi:hypothetical protein